MNAAFVVGSPLCEAYISGLLLFEQAVFCAYYLSQVLGNSARNGQPEKGKVSKHCWQFNFGFKIVNKFFVILIIFFFNWLISDIWEPHQKGIEK